MTLKSFDAIPDSPALRADRLARALEKFLFPHVIAHRHPRVQYSAVQAAARYSVPVPDVLAHPCIAGLAALERWLG